MSLIWPTSHVGMLHPFGGARARAQCIEFLRLAEATREGLSYSQAKTLFTDVDQATVETRKSLYEELGLLYVPKGSNSLHLTPVGLQILNLLGTDVPEDASPALRNRVDSLLCWAMAHTQINRPQSLGSPSADSVDRSNCDIRPYATFWQAMLDLGGSVSFEEFHRVIAHTQSAADYPIMLQTILEGRTTGILPAAPLKSSNFGIYWKAHLSVGGAVLNTANELFTFAPNRQDVVTSILDFQLGCEGGNAAIQARPWKDIHEYYSTAGEECPAFIASGQSRVVSIGGEAVVMLKGYSLQRDATGYYVDGGKELCALKISMPCFHNSHPARLLRVDRKSRTNNGDIRIELGLGRPITDPAQLTELWSA